MALLETRDYQSADDMMAEYSARRQRLMAQRPVTAKTSELAPPLPVSTLPAWSAPSVEEIPTIDKLPVGAWSVNYGDAVVVLISGKTYRLKIEAKAYDETLVDLLDQTQWLRRPDGSYPQNAKDIISAVCTHYGVSNTELVSHRRFQKATKHRQEAMWWVHKLTTHSLPSIGRLFGGRDHTTALHAVRKHQMRIELGEV